MNECVKMGFTQLEHLNHGRPFRYAVRCRKTGIEKCQDHEPLLHNLQTYEPTDDPNVMDLRTTKDVRIDTRYDARLRLWKYVTFTKKGLPVPKYSPFSGTEIGKSIPVLPF